MLPPAPTVMYVPPLAIEIKAAEVECTVYPSVAVRTTPSHCALLSRQCPGLFPTLLQAQRAVG